VFKSLVFFWKVCGFANLTCRDNNRANTLAGNHSAEMYLLVYIIIVITTTTTTTITTLHLQFCAG